MAWTLSKVSPLMRAVSEIGHHLSYSSSLENHTEKAINSITKKKIDCTFAGKLNWLLAQFSAIGLVTHQTSLGCLLRAAKPHIVHIKDSFCSFVDFLWGAGRPGIKSFPPAISIRGVNYPNVFTSMHLLLVNLS